MKIRHLVAAGLAAAFVGLPAPALACPIRDLARGVATADVAFVGTVASLRHRVAIITVREVWRGLDLPAEVDLEVGNGVPGYNTGDRSFEVGTEYLFVPFLTDGGLRDDVCSMTQPWSDELSNLRPATARPPLAESTVDPISVPLLIAIGVAAVVALLGFALPRRLNQPDTTG